MPSSCAHICNMLRKRGEQVAYPMFQGTIFVSLLSARRRVAWLAFLLNPGPIASRLARPARLHPPDGYFT